jgi:head-tail adaptor
MLSHRLRHRITIEDATESQDSEGEMIKTWASLIVDSLAYENVPAEVLTGAGRNKMSSGAEQNEYDCRINLRWFNISLVDLLACRVKWNGRIYEIVSAEQDITARREWRLSCKSGTEVYQD